MISYRKIQELYIEWKNAAEDFEKQMRGKEEEQIVCELQRQTQKLRQLAETGMRIEKIEFVRENKIQQMLEEI